MTTTIGPLTKERLQRIADRLREYSSELDLAGCRIEETDGTNSQEISRATQLIDDAAYILEEIKLS